MSLDESGDVGVGLFSAEIRPVAADLGYAKKTSNDKARRLLEWKSRASREAIVAAGHSMVKNSLLKP